MPLSARGSKRLQSELQELMRDAPSGCSAAPAGDEFQEWTATIAGPADSPYEGGAFKLSIHFTDDYPFKPMKVRFLTQVWHPNVDPGGIPCINILKDAYNAAMSVGQLLMSMRLFLADPCV